MENGNKSILKTQYTSKLKIKKAITSLRKFMEKDYKLCETSVYKESKAAKNLRAELESLNVTSFGEFDLQSFAKFIITEQKKRIT